MDRKRRIAVIVRDRQAEAFRMSVGLTVLDDSVDVFLTRPVIDKGENLLQFEGVKEIGIKVFSTVPGTDFEYITSRDMAERLLGYDNILPY